jgi:hypothetical protein
MRFLVALARALVGRPPPRDPETAVDDMPAFIPRENPLESEEGEEARRNAAMRMIDEDCYGYLLLTVHRDAGEGVRGHVELAMNVLPQWWPAINKTLRRIIAVQRAGVAP